MMGRPKGVVKVKAVVVLAEMEVVVVLSAVAV